jgi:hypothetical protein
MYMYVLFCLQVFEPCVLKAIKYKTKTLACVHHGFVAKMHVCTLHTPEHMHVCTLTFTQSPELS